MTDKIQEAVDRLNRILPLKARQDALAPELAELHRDMLRSWVEKGRTLTRTELDARVADPDTAVSILGDNDLVVFSSDGEPRGAYPFTMEPRKHRLRVNGHQVYCMCALDALAVSPMFELPVTIESQCHVTDRALTIEQAGEDIGAAKDMFFGIQWSAADTGSCCADSLCMEMVFLADGDVALEWFCADPGGREIFKLVDAVEFAARFFLPLGVRAS